MPSTRIALAQRAAKHFEQAFDPVVVVFAFGLQVQRATHGVGERAEEVLDHFGAEIADALIVELGLVLRCGRPEISSAQRARHSSIGSTKPKRAMPRLSPSALFNASPSAAGVLYGVVIVDIQVAFDVDLHAEAAVGGDLIQHVVEEADAGFDFAAAFAIQPDVDIDLRLFGHAVNPRMTVAQGQLAHDLFPAQHAALVAQP